MIAAKSATSPVRIDSRENAFGFLRLLFAAMVLYSHVWFLAGPTKEPYASWLFHDAEFPGGIGVKGFFVLSGFLVMRSERRLAGPRAFLWCRGLRIYPALWLCLVVTGLGFPWVEQLVRTSTVIDWSDATRYVGSNWFQPRTQPGIRGLLTHAYYGGDLNGSLWTLPYEMGCYAILAFVGGLGLTRGSARGAWIAGAALLTLYAHDVARPLAALFFKSDGRNLGVWFVLGALAALLDASTLRRWLSPTVVTVLALAWVASWRLGGHQFVGPVAIGALVLWASWALPIRALEERIGGDYSYGLYIYSYPVTQMLVEFGAGALGLGWLFVLSLVITFAFAVASWHLIERRALRMKSIFARPIPNLSAA